ncbi:MAG TPA: hypothetical protein VKU88_05775 [Acidimicrobiales bacterium]|nr:hypothetical protein [Acidimicrobiales bacterium]
MSGTAWTHHGYSIGEEYSLPHFVVSWTTVTDAAERISVEA